MMNVIHNAWTNNPHLLDLSAIFWRENKDIIKKPTEKILGNVTNDELVQPWERGWQGQKIC